VAKPYPITLGLATKPDPRVLGVMTILDLIALSLVVKPYPK
jgi:hypothetical protein